MNTFSYSIRTNNMIMRSVCPITGESFKPDSPLWVFVDTDTGPVPVSETAMREKAPILNGVLEVINSAGRIHNVDFGDSTTDPFSGEGLPF